MGSSPICCGLLSSGLAGKWNKSWKILKKQPFRPGGEGALGLFFFPGSLATTSLPPPSDLQAAPLGCPLDLTPPPSLSHYRCVNLGASWILP